MRGSRSVDLREQALAAFSGGMKRSQVCEVFGMHRTTLRRWHKRAEVDQLENRPRCGGPRQIKPEAEASLVRQLEATPDATLDEHVASWQQQTGQRVSRDTMRRAILRAGEGGWTRKKRA